MSENVYANLPVEDALSLLRSALREAADARNPDFYVGKIEALFAAYGAACQREAERAGDRMTYRMVNNLDPYNVA